MGVNALYSNTTGQVSIQQMDMGHFFITTQQDITIQQMDFMQC